MLYVVTDRFGLNWGKKKDTKFERKKPRYKLRRIEKSIVEWRQDLARVEEMGVSASNLKGTTRGLLFISMFTSGVR